MRTVSALHIHTTWHVHLSALSPSVYKRITKNLSLIHLIICHNSIKILPVFTHFSLELTVLCIQISGAFGSRSRNRLSYFLSPHLNSIDAFHKACKRTCNCSAIPFLSLIITVEENLCSLRGFIGRFRNPRHTKHT